MCSYPVDVGTVFRKDIQVYQFASYGADLVACRLTLLF